MAKFSNHHPSVPSARPRRYLDKHRAAPFVLTAEIIVMIRPAADWGPILSLLPSPPRSHRRRSSTCFYL